MPRSVIKKVFQLTDLKYKTWTQLEHKGINYVVTQFQNI